MTSRPQPEQPDWLIPLVLVAIAALLAITAIVFFSLRSTPPQDETLAMEMEEWTTCLRSEGAPVPLVEATRGGGFRVTFDDVVFDTGFDGEAFRTAFDLCVDDAPEAIRTFTDVISGFSSLPFGGDDLGWLWPMLSGIADQGMFDDPQTGFPPFGEPGLDELCAQLDDLELVVPEVAAELRELCPAGAGV